MKQELPVLHKGGNAIEHPEKGEGHAGPRSAGLAVCTRVTSCPPGPRGQTLEAKETLSSVPSARFFLQLVSGKAFYRALEKPWSKIPTLKSSVADCSVVVHHFAFCILTLDPRHSARSQRPVNLAISSPSQRNQYNRLPVRERTHSSIFKKKSRELRVESAG